MTEPTREQREEADAWAAKAAKNTPYETIMTAVRNCPVELNIHRWGVVPDAQSIYQTDGPVCPLGAVLLGTQAKLGRQWDAAAVLGVSEGWVTGFEITIGGCGWTLESDLASPDMIAGRAVAERVQQTMEERT